MPRTAHTANPNLDVAGYSARWPFSSAKPADVGRHIQVPVKKGICIYTIVMVVIIQIVQLLACSPLPKTNMSIFDLPESFWKVFNVHFDYVEEGSTHVNTDGVDYESFQENTKDYVNYYIMAQRVIMGCYSYYFFQQDETVLNDCEIIMENIMKTYDKYHSFPRPEYKYIGYEYGWVSAMDAPVIMVASQMLYEITDNTKYKDFVETLKEYVVLTTSEGGYNYEFSENTIWPLEYAKKTALHDTNKYVLNGSLTGYLAILAINEVLEDHTLDRYIEKINNGYSIMFSSFHYKNDAWTYYCLNPRNVIPIHYLIYERKLFQACYDLNNNALFRDELDFRTTLLKKSLNVELCNNDDGSASYYMLRAGIPNEYQIDCFQTRIDFVDSMGNVCESKENIITGSMAGKLDDFYEGMFIFGIIKNPEIVKSYKVYSNNGSGWDYLFENEIQYTKNSNELKPQNTTLTCLYDARLEGNTIIIDPELSDNPEGCCVWEFDKSYENSKNFYIIEIENLSKTPIITGITLYDEFRLGASRYHTKTIPGKNLIICDPCGFVNSADLNSIKSICLRLYNQSSDKMKVRVGNVYITDSIRELYDYINTTEYMINPE